MREQDWLDLGLETHRNAACREVIVIGVRLFQDAHIPITPAVSQDLSVL